LNDGLIEALRDVFQNLPEEAKAAVIVWRRRIISAQA